jgi:hypothetical protein
MNKPRQTTDGNPPQDGHWTGPAPSPTDATGQHKSYWVLPEEERAKGFIRPVRRSYKHVGPRPPSNLRDLTSEEHERYDRFAYVKYEAYGEEESPVTGRFWTQSQLDAMGGCGSITTMGQSIAETYARDPSYYGSTFCCQCKTHLPIEQFVWDGTDERVGS